MDQDQATKDWLEGDYISGKFCNDGDLIEVVEQSGLQENAFGKRKFEFKVLYNGKVKTLSASRKQFGQITNGLDHGCKVFTIAKKPFGNTFVLEFSPMVSTAPGH